MSLEQLRGLEMAYMSSAGGARFAWLATEMAERTRRLGSNPLRKQAEEDDEHQNQIEEDK